MEIEKLALYAAGEGTVTLDHVEAVTSDVAASVLNTLIDAAFDGRRDAVDRDYRRFRHEGLDPRRAGLSPASRPDSSSRPGSSRGGQGIAGAVAAWRGLHFRRQQAVEAQLGRWRSDGLREAVARLQEAVLACRRADPALGPPWRSTPCCGSRAGRVRRRRLSRLQPRRPISPRGGGS